MDSLWLLPIAIIFATALPLGAFGLHRHRTHKRERALARRRKEKIRL